LLIAGGIGITPLLAMGRQLAANAADFRLVYCSRSPETTAFLDVLAEPAFAGKVLIHHDHGERDRSIDLTGLLAEFADDTHVYCCGPRPLMLGVQEATRHWPFSTVHFEDFGSAPAEAVEGDGPFLIELAKQGVTLEVPPELSILEVLRKNDIRVPSSCESGTCGACRTQLLEGEAVHYDYVLDEHEHADTIMICVSRAKSKVLKLNI
jgi:phthalate 4,5-dioxygenase reductase subunit